MKNPDPQKPPPKPLATAHLRGAHFRRALIWTLRTAMYGLIILSVLGTFYALSSQPAPLLAPGTIWRDVTTTTATLWTALAIQGILMLGQWGGVELAREDRRWWLLYAGCLVASVAANWSAYMPPLTDPAALGLPWLLAALIIVGGDVLPEWLLKR